MYVRRVLTHTGDVNGAICSEGTIFAIGVPQLNPRRTCNVLQVPRATYHALGGMNKTQYIRFALGPFAGVVDIF
jgi:hypothetical protein